MAIDGGLRRLFKVKLPHYHWTAIETGGTGKGIPDSNFCVGGFEGWVEYKQTDGWRVTLSPEQVGWHLKRARCGGHTIIAVRRKAVAGPKRGPAVDELWLFPGYMAEKLLDEGIQKEWRMNPPPHIQFHGTGDWNWPLVDVYLTTRKKASG